MRDSGKYLKSGSFQPEWWQLWPGIGGNFETEWVAVLLRIMHNKGTLPRDKFPLCCWQAAIVFMQSNADQHRMSLSLPDSRFRCSVEIRTEPAPNL